MTGPNSPHPFFPLKKPPKFLPFLPFLPFLTNLGYLQKKIFFFGKISTPSWVFGHQKVQKKRKILVF